MPSAFSPVDAEDRRHEHNNEGGLNLGGLGQIGSIGGSGAFTAPAPRLTHQLHTTDFQPPYFPPPYNPPPPQPQPPAQQSVDYHNLANMDPYSHHYNAYSQMPQHHHYNPIHTYDADRNIIRNREESLPQYDLHSSLPNNALYDMRRHDYNAVINGGHEQMGMQQDQRMLDLHEGMSSPEEQLSCKDEDNEYMLQDDSDLDKAVIRHKNENQELILSQNISPADIFCSVPSRLSLLSATAKYKVSVAEVQRRLSPPECLNASLLGGIMRRAKSKNGGKSLRDSLDKIGLSLPAGKRKMANVTLFTALVEGETIQLAKDYSYICEAEFPSKQCAEYNHRQYYDPNDHGRKNRILATKQLIKEFTDLLSKDRSPLGITRPQQILEPTMQKHLTHFSLLTHGFGSPSMVASMTAVQSYLTEMVKLLDKGTPPHQQ